MFGRVHFSSERNIRGGTIDDSVNNTKPGRGEAGTQITTVPAANGDVDDDEEEGERSVGGGGDTRAHQHTSADPVCVERRTRTTETE